MKVIHISAANSRSGAGIACLELHKSLLAGNKIESRVLFIKDDTLKDSTIKEYEVSFATKLKRKVYTFLDNSLTFKYFKRKKELIFSAGIFGLDLANNELIKDADIIHLHWVNHGFVSLKNIIACNKPIVWTMHDCWVFTGGCHHFFTCDRYETECGKCPNLGSTIEKDISYKVLNIKKNLIQNNTINFVAISSWMKVMASKSAILKNKPISVIPSGINIGIFKVYDCLNELKKKLKINSEEKIILLGAHSVSSPYKGMSYSIDALNTLMLDNITIITFGNGKIQLSNKKHRLINYGFVESQIEMSKLYNLADVFLCSSIAEGFGMTVAEAQCCGTPAIAFRNTGPSDIIEHHITGYLADFQDSKSLNNGINFCLKNTFRRQDISRRAHDNFSIQKSALRYKELYSNCSINNDNAAK